MKISIKILVSLLAIIVAGGAYILFFLYEDTQDPYVQACDYSVADEVIPKFTEVEVSFSHQFNDAKSLPLMATALIDVDGDGTDEIFVGGGNDQTDALFAFEQGKFTNIGNSMFRPKAKDDPSLGAVSADMNNDGLPDLVICRNSGVYLYLNKGDSFVGNKLSIPLNERSTPVSISLGDINRDGWLDMFVAAYIKVDKMEGQTIFNDPNYGASSLLMQNNGDNSFTDITKTSGLDYVHNTFQGMLVDVDEDGLLDLVVAHDTGEVRTYKNLNGTIFEMKENPLTGKFAYPMGIAAGDYNNDGRIDFFFSNTGSSVPEFMARGDLRKEQVFVKDWILFRNDGDFNFFNAAVETKLSDFEFSWGATFEDFNLDGLIDLSVAENYINYPPHKAFKLPCRLLIQQENGRFAAVEEQAGVVNKNYAITPLSSDFNGDGYPDLIYSNLDGPLKVFVSNGGDGKFLKVRMIKNATTLGAKIRVRNGGSVISDFLVSGEGLCSDQSSTLTFGLGKNLQDSVIVEVTYPSGEQRQKTVSVNTTTSL